MLVRAGASALRAETVNFSTSQRRAQFVKERDVARLDVFTPGKFLNTDQVQEGRYLLGVNFQVGSHPLHAVLVVGPFSVCKSSNKRVGRIKESLNGSR